MANDTFIPPVMRGEVQDMSERFSRTPERTDDIRPYTSLVEWGEAIRSYRPTALAINQAERARMSWLERMTTIPSDAPQTMEELLNRDLHAGGKQFGENFIFGLTDTNQDLEERYGEPVLDFIFAELDPGQVNPKYALTYRVTSHSVEKIYNAGSYTLTISELQNFMQRVQTYRTLIRQEFYPIDDLIESDDMDFEETESQQYKSAA